MSQDPLHVRFLQRNTFNDNTCDLDAYGGLVDFQVPTSDNSTRLSNLRSGSVLHLSLGKC